MKTLTPLLVSGTAGLALVHAQSSAPESEYHYTPYWSSWSPVTVYATVTESTTIFTPVPTTVYVTIPTTTTIVESFTTTTTTPTTTTTTTPTTTTTTTPTTTTTTTPTTTTKPVTATEIVKEIITSQVEQVTITLCTSRDTNPTYTAAILPLPSDYTWGCPPGYLCKPAQINCNFEAGLPSESYYCSPDECIPATPLPPPQNWNPTIYGNASPAIDPTLKYNAVGSYFNMNPGDYGLSYEIFVEDQFITYTYTTTILEAPSPTVKARQAQTSVPAACYPWCNNCLLEAQSVGKTPALCSTGSAFEVDVNDCEQCIAYHKSDSTGTFVKIAPQFQQFINYCAQISSTTIVSSAASTSASTPLPIVQSSSSSIPSTTSSSISSGVPSSSAPPPPSSSAPPPPSSSAPPPPPPPSSSTVTATITVAGPTTATVGAASTPISSTTVTPTTPSTWTTTLILTLSGPTNVSISAYTPDTTKYSTSTLTSTMTLDGPTTITYSSGSVLPGSQTLSTSTPASAPPATFTGGVASMRAPSGIWTSLFGALGSIVLACVFWI